MKIFKNAVLTATEKFEKKIIKCSFVIQKDNVFESYNILGKKMETYSSYDYFIEGQRIPEILFTRITDKNVDTFLQDLKNTKKQNAEIKLASLKRRLNPETRINRPSEYQQFYYSPESTIMRTIGGFVTLMGAIFFIAYCLTKLINC